MKKYRQEQLNYIDTFFPDFKHGSLSNETHTWFHVDRNPDGSIVGNPPLKIDAIGKTFPDPDYFVARERSRFFIIEYICSGVGHLFCNGKEFTVKKGDVYILEIGSKHSYYADRQDPFEKMWINLKSDLFEQLYKDMGLSGIIHFPNVPCEDLFLELMKLDEISSFNNDICYDALEILMRILTRLTRSLKDQSARIPQSILQVKRLLDSSFYGTITIDDICSQLYLSRSYVIKKFKECYGTTPHKYLLDGKIKLATSLLRKSGAPIKEIALSLGFFDEYHFSNLFKRKMGISPKAYRAASKPH